MEKLEKVLGIISFICAFLLMVFLMPQTPLYKETVKGSPTIEEYTMLREENVNYAKTLEFDKENSNGIEVKTEIKDDFIIITTSKELRCKIKATYPIIKNTDSSFKINYEDGIYEAIPQTKGILLIVIWVILILIYELGIYSTLYYIALICIKIKKAIKPKIKLIKEKIILRKQKKDSKLKK